MHVLFASKGVNGANRLMVCMPCRWSKGSCYKRGLQRTMRSMLTFMSVCRNLSKGTWLYLIHGGGIAILVDGGPGTVRVRLRDQGSGVFSFETLSPGLDLGLESDKRYQHQNIWGHCDRTIKRWGPVNTVHFCSTHSILNSSSSYGDSTWTGLNISFHHLSIPTSTLFLHKR